MSKLKIIGKLNPKQYSEMLDHLTRKKIKNPFIKAKDIVVNKKPEVEQREMFNRFNQANPRQDMAGGGMLVQPGFGGTRQGYKEEKYISPSDILKNIDIPEIKKQKYVVLLKGINKWKKDPSAENWIEIFRRSSKKIWL